MKIVFKRTWKTFCVFFVGIMVCTLFLPNEVIGVQAKAPQSSFNIDGERKYVSSGIYWGYATSHYQIRLISYDEKNNTAVYKIGCWWYLENYVILGSDNLYVNDQYIGTFNSKNGIYPSGNNTISRTEWFYVTLKGSKNTIETRNVYGEGGDFRRTLYLDQIGNNPIVHATNGTWYEGEVASGVRTWQSLYTDGASGSTEGNKIQTSTGFMYSDPDEQPIPVNAYSSAKVGDSARIEKITNSSGAIVDINALNNIGTYTVYTYTTDSSGLMGYGFRSIEVKRKNIPPTITSEDRWFYASEQVSNQRLLEKVKANDAEDGDIKDKVRIKASNVISGVVGEYQVTYEVEDSQGGSAESTANIHIISDEISQGEGTRYLRFINEEYLYTLKDDSIWLEPSHYQRLEASLRKEPENAIAHIRLTKEDVINIQGFNDANDYAAESNARFYEQFRYLWKEGE